MKKFLDGWKEKILDYKFTPLHPGESMEQKVEEVESGMIGGWMHWADCLEN